MTGYKLSSVQLASLLYKESMAVMKCTVPGVTIFSALGVVLTLQMIFYILQQLVTSLKTMQ
jgi:hypothetical protein